MTDQKWEQVPGRLFVEARAHVPQKYQHHLAPFTAEQLDRQAYRCYLARYSGFAVAPDGEIVNVFALRQARPGEGRTMMEFAKTQRGTRVEFYDGWLAGFYSSLGFVEVERVPFDDEYAPDGYDYEANGRPDYVVARFP
jgi:hypothetical protein